MDKVDTSNFKKAIAYEKSQQPVADNLYIRQFCNKNDIYRYDYDKSAENQWYQHQDIDCSIIDRNNPLKLSQRPSQARIYISEKFRSEDWGDMTIELYSSYYKDKLGWGVTSGEILDYYFYFVRSLHNDRYGTAYQISRRVVKELADMFLNAFNEWDLKNDFLINKNKTIKAKLCGMNVSFMKIWSHNGKGDEWMGISVNVPWYEIKNLSEKRNAEFKEYLTVLNP